MKLNTCLLLGVFIAQVIAKSVFSCGDLWDSQSDAEALPLIEEAVKNNDRIGVGCVSTLINKNFYETANYLFQNYYRKKKNVS